MRPAYWIGILALAGAVLAYVLFEGAGIHTTLGIVVGALLGTLIFARSRRGA